MAKQNKNFVQNAEKDIERNDEKEKKKRRKGLFSKIIVVSVITLNVIFAVAVLFVFLKTSCEPTGLVASWFSFTTVELWSLAGIKKAKEKKSDGEG